MRKIYFIILLLAATACSNGAGDEVPENTPLPLEHNTVPQKDVVIKADKNLSIAAGNVVAGSRVNPFLTMEEERAFGAAAGREVLTNVKLTAIAYSDKNSYAVLNGSVVKEGDIFNRKKVFQINNDSVIL
jgi:hypothetical protein